MIRFFIEPWNHPCYALGEIIRFRMDLIPFKLFNDRAKRLKSSRFLEVLRTRPKNPGYNPTDLDDWMSHKGLRPDDLDAFALNLRLLIQDRDGYSIRRLSELYKELPDYMQQERILFETARNGLNNYLDKRSFVQIEGRNFKNIDLFNIIFYGGLVHNDMNKFNDYRKLMKNNLFSILTFVTLWNIIVQFNQCIQRISLINECIIKQIEEPSP